MKIQAYIFIYTYTKWNTHAAIYASAIYINHTREKTKAYTQFDDNDNTNKLLKPVKISKTK